MFVQSITAFLKQALDPQNLIRTVPDVMVEVLT